MSQELIDAASEGNLQRVKELIENEECEIDYQGDDGYTPLLSATWKGHTEVVRYLLSKNARIDIRRRPDNLPIIHLLLTPLDVPFANKKEIAELLIKANADINAVGNPIGKTALYSAILFNRLDIADYLIEKGATYTRLGLINTAIGLGVPPLEQFMQKLKWCIARGCEINPAVIDLNWSERYRAENNFPKALEVEITMLQHRIIKECRDTPLVTALGSGGANQNHRLEVITFLLDELNANPNLPTVDGNLPLFLVRKDPTLVKLLISRGGTLNNTITVQSGSDSKIDLSQADISAEISFPIENRLSFEFSLPIESHLPFSMPPLHQTLFSVPLTAFIAMNYFALTGKLINPALTLSELFKRGAHLYQRSNIEDLETPLHIAYKAKQIQVANRLILNLQGLPETQQFQILTAKNRKRKTVFDVALEEILGAEEKAPAASGSIPQELKLEPLLPLVKVLQHHVNTLVLRLFIAMPILHRFHDNREFHFDLIIHLYQFIAPKKDIQFGTTTPAIDYFERMLRTAFESTKIANNALMAQIEDADQNDPEAQYNVALTYEKGLGVQRNLVLALEYFKKAKDQYEKELNKTSARITKEISNYKENRDTKEISETTNKKNENLKIRMETLKAKVKNTINKIGVIDKIIEPVRTTNRKNLCIAFSAFKIKMPVKEQMLIADYLFEDTESSRDLRVSAGYASTT